MTEITYEIRDRVAEIMFQNPPVNALSVQLLDTYLEMLEAAGKDDSVRAVIIGSKVPGRFCAGLNLRALYEQSGTTALRALLERLYVRMTDVQFSLSKPSIAAIGGTARGGGMTIAISCDLIVASRNATFGYPEIDAGVLPSIHFTHLPGIVGRHRAFDLLFTGRAFDAQEAYDLGLISRLVEPGQEIEEARKLARTLAEKSPEAITVGRNAFMQANDNGYRRAVRAAADSFCLIADSESGREGIAAFVEKRVPIWRRQ